MVVFKKNFKDDFVNAYESMRDLNKYRKEYRKGHKRLELLIGFPSYALLQKAAKQHNRDLGPFILESSLAYLNEGFILPDDTQEKAVMNALHRWGNNLNQIAFHVNKGRYADDQRIAQAAKLVQELDGFVRSTYRQPVSIRKAIEEEAKTNPWMVPKLQYILSTIKL